MSEPIAVDTPAAAPIYLESYEAHKSAIRAIPIDALEKITVDPLLAVQLAEKALPRLKQLRPRLLDVFKNFDLSSVDNMPGYARAYAHLSMLLRASAPQVSGFEALVDECGDMLAKMVAYLRAADEAGLVDASKLSELKGSVGYRNTVHDLLLVVNIYRANWSKIEGKTFLTLADIRRGDELAARLNSAIAERDSKPDGFEDLSLERQQSYSLCIRTYTRVRDAVEYVLKQENQLHILDEVMPSPFNYRTGKKRPGSSDTETETEASAAEAAPTPAPTSATPPSSKGKIGMPDSDPFTS